MNFFAIERFNKSINNLLAKKKNYGCVLSHIYKRFNDASDDELFETGYRLNGNHPVARLMKVRILSCGRNAKSEGFRLIVFVNKNEKKYYFLDIYPKTGPLTKSNMKKVERRLCINELKFEKANNELYNIFFDNTKKTIVIKK